MFAISKSATLEIDTKTAEIIGDDATQSINNSLNMMVKINSVYHFISLPKFIKLSNPQEFNLFFNITLVVTVVRYPFYAAG